MVGSSLVSDFQWFQRHKWKWILTLASVFSVVALLNGISHISKFPIFLHRPSCNFSDEHIYSGAVKNTYLILMALTLENWGYAADLADDKLFISGSGAPPIYSEGVLNSENKIARMLASGITINGIHYPTSPLARKLIKERWEGWEYQKMLAETLAQEGEHTIWPTDRYYFIRDCAIKRALVMEPEEPVPPDGLPDLRFLSSVRPISEEPLSITIPPLANTEPPAFWVRWLQEW